LEVRSNSPAMVMFVPMLFMQHFRFESFYA